MTVLVVIIGIANLAVFKDVLTVSHFATFLNLIVSFDFVFRFRHDTRNNRRVNGMVLVAVLTNLLYAPESAKIRRNSALDSFNSSVLIF